MLQNTRIWKTNELINAWILPKFRFDAFLLVQLFELAQIITKTKWNKNIKIDLTKICFDSNQIRAGQSLLPN